MKLGDYVLVRVSGDSISEKSFDGSNRSDHDKNDYKISKVKIVNVRLTSSKGEITVDGSDYSNCWQINNYLDAVDIEYRNIKRGWVLFSKSYKVIEKCKACYKC